MLLVKGKGLTLLTDCDCSVPENKLVIYTIYNMFKNYFLINDEDREILSKEHVFLS